MTTASRTVSTPSTIASQRADMRNGKGMNQITCRDGNIAAYAPMSEKTAPDAPIHMAPASVARPLECGIQLLTKWGTHCDVSGMLGKYGRSANKASQPSPPMMPPMKNIAKKRLDPTSASTPEPNKSKAIILNKR